MFLLQNRVTRISWRDKWMRLYNYGKKNEHKQKNQQQQFYICVFVYTLEPPLPPPWLQNGPIWAPYALWVGLAIRYPYAFGSLVFAFGLHKNNWPLFHSLSCVCVFFFCFKFAVEVIKGIVKPINRPMAWLWWQLSTFSPVFFFVFMNFSIIPVIAFI